MTRDQRIWRIIGRLGGSNELTLQRIETELGLTPRPESPDAGRPYNAIMCFCGMSGPCRDSNCQHPIVTRSAKYMGQADDNPNAPMTPVRERGHHD